MTSQILFLTSPIIIFVFLGSAVFSIWSTTKKTSSNKLKANMNTLSLHTFALAIIITIQIIQCVYFSIMQFSLAKFISTPKESIEFPINYKHLLNAYGNWLTACFFCNIGLFTQQCIILHFFMSYGKKKDRPKTSELNDELVE